MVFIAFDCRIPGSKTGLNKNKTNFMEKHIFIVLATQKKRFSLLLLLFTWFTLKIA